MKFTKPLELFVAVCFFFFFNFSVHSILKKFAISAQKAKVEMRANQETVSK